MPARAAVKVDPDDEKSVEKISSRGSSGVNKSQKYDAAQIEAQKKAANDANALGWMLWNAGSLFHRGGLAPK